jgi:hypothetical protein
VAAPSANRINARAAKDKAFLARALKNPGLRAKLDPKFLSAPQRASRTLNARLNAPIVPGSSTTERDLAHEAQAAQTVRYGPQDAALGQQLGVAQQTERDTGSLYDQYRQALQQHSANISAFQAGAQQALGALQQGVTGLGQQSAVQMAQSAAPTQSAVAAPSGDLATLANQALAVRQAQAGTFGAEQALTGAAANTYADTQANVVAPGQKLGALAQARDGRATCVRSRRTSRPRRARSTSSSAPSAAPTSSRTSSRCRRSVSTRRSRRGCDGHDDSACSRARRRARLPRPQPPRKPSRRRSTA